MNGKQSVGISSYNALAAEGWTVLPALFFRNGFNRFLFSFIIVVWLVTPPALYAHHESLAAPEREYLNFISLHPFKDKVIRDSGYDFYITMVESAPQTVDLIFYLEHPLFKRPVHSAKEVLLHVAGSDEPQRFILETDIAGVSSLRYRYREPFEAELRITASAPDGQILMAETKVQIGSPGPSRAFLAMFGLIIIGVLLFRRSAK